MEKYTLVTRNALGHAKRCKMASQTSYSIYVRFRGKRLALLKHIRSLETARAALRAFRADRFHDADQVFLVNDQTKEAVNDVDREPAPHDGGGGGGSNRERARAGSPDVHAEPDVRAERARAALPDPGKEHEPEAVEARLATAPRDPRAARPPSRQGPQEADPRPSGAGAAAPDEARSNEPDPPESGPESETDPPIIRLRRAMVAARSARARHDAALEAVLKLQPNGVLEDREILRIEASARAASNLSARALAQLESFVALLEHTGS